MTKTVVYAFLWALLAVVSSAVGFGVMIGFEMANRLLDYFRF